ncbi:MAG: hypothetical protein ACXVY9_00950 [Terriglobales bacterium]
MSTQILVVDDEQPAAFESNGYSVVSAASAAEAVTTLAARPFDAVITDMKWRATAPALMWFARRVPWPILPRC